jgi:16S rRNA (cytidine1402-2'-O)-methyltransferase
LSDPGYELVRAALEAGYAVTPIPGPTAAVAALVASGLPTDAFVYLGFLPRKAQERQALLASVQAEPRTLIAYEAPHRLLDTLADIHTLLGDRPVAVARELTKLHEEIFRGPVSTALTYFGAKEILGEITLIIGGAPAQAKAHWDEARVLQEAHTLLEQGERAKEVAKHIAHASGWKAREVYQLIIAQRQ